MADSGSTGDEAVQETLHEVETGAVGGHNGDQMNNFIEPTGEEINPNAVIDSFEQNSFEQAQVQQSADMGMFTSQVRFVL